MKLLDHVRQVMTEMEYTPATIRTYARWMVRYIHFHQLQHPARLGRAGIERYITHLAVVKHTASSTQNQALDALVLLYQIIEQPVDVGGLRARTSRRLPETASKREIMAVIDRLSGRDWLMAVLCYGSGLTVSECAKLRIRQLYFMTNSIILTHRVTVLPDLGREQLQAQAALARDWPGNVDGYVFPSSRMHGGRCWHVSPSSLQKAMKRVAPEHKRITPQVLRASFGQHMLERYDPRTVQEALGHRNVKTTLRLERKRMPESPLDALERYTEKTVD